MDNNTRVYELRNKYNEFRYKSYSISEDEDNIYLRYNFEITNLCEFNPSITIIKGFLRFSYSLVRTFFA